MTEIIDVEIPIRVVPVNSAFRAIPRGNFCTSIKSAKYRQFEIDALKLLPKKNCIKGEVEVTLEFHLKTRYEVTDVDNLNKTTIDVLATAGYFENDNRIVALHSYKYKSDKDYIKVIITEI